MPEAGLEPASPEGRGILSPLSGVKTAPKHGPALSVVRPTAGIPNRIPSPIPTLAPGEFLCGGFGTLTSEAISELADFRFHLTNHRHEEVDGCRYCVGRRNGRRRQLAGSVS
jgi:hypothetical protein